MFIEGIEAAVTGLARDALNAIGVCIGAIVLVAKVKKRSRSAQPNGEQLELGPEKPRRP